jgi:hypothetical protein
MEQNSIPVGFTKTEGSGLNARVLGDCINCGGTLTLSIMPSAWRDPSPESVYCRNCSASYTLALVPEDDRNA